MIHEVYDGCDEFAHVGLQIVRSGIEIGIDVVEVGGHDPVEIAFLICFVKRSEPIGEETEGGAYIHTLGVHFLKLSGCIDHRTAGRDHVVYDDTVFAVYIVTEKFVSDYRVLAVYHLGIITSLVEHTGVQSEDRCEIDRSVQGTFIGRDDDGVILIYDHIALVT